MRKFFGYGKEETQKVKIAHVPVVQALPLYVAIEKGYFKDAGIEVEAVEFHSPNQVIDALLSGQVNFGAISAAAGIATITENARSDALKIFAVIGGGRSVTNDVLLVRKGSVIRSIAHLKGKKLGILTGTQFRVIAQYILARNSLSLGRDVTLVELAVPMQVQALASGYVDALLTLEPVATIAKSKGVARDLIRSPMVKYIADPWYGSVGIVRTAFLKHHPETAKKVLVVLDKAMSDIRQHPGRCRGFLKGYTSLDQATKKRVPLPVFKMVRDFEESDIEALQKFFDIFSECGTVSRKTDVKDVIYRG